MTTQAVSRPTSFTVPTPSADAVLLFEEMAAIATCTGKVAPAIQGGDRNVYWALWRATVGLDQPVPGAERWWSEATYRLVHRFPEADHDALGWVCDIIGRHSETARIRGPQWAKGHSLDSSYEWLKLWALRRPVPDSADRIEAALLDSLPPAIQGIPPWTRNAYNLDWANVVALNDLVDLLPRFCADDPDASLDRQKRLLDTVVARRTTSYWSDSIVHHLVREYAPRLWDAGRLSLDERLAALTACPWLVYELGRPQRSPAQRQELRDALTALIDRVLQRGAVDRDAQSGLTRYRGYAGAADFSAALRWLDRPAGGKNDAWAVHALRHLPPPSPEDVERIPELAGIKAETFFAACVFSPTWAAAVEQVLPSHGLKGIADFARWAAPLAGPSPWVLDYDGNREDEWDLGAVPAERAALQTVIAEIGEERVRKLLKLPLLRKHAKTAGFCLAAVLGENAAEVEAKFLKRDKWAVVALGMLPDEGDVQDRYLALRRFAQEAKNSGPQRGASEAIAVQIALAHLAVTGGYEDAETLEWAVETRLAADVDPATKRWSAGGYDFWVQPDERAAIRVERGGKPLKSVPAAVRGTPEYSEAKEARELLLAQAERVRRRLERAMVKGEVFDRAAYDQLLALPAGRRLLPRVVLRVRLPGADAPIEILDGRTLEREPLAFGREARVQIAHPLHLAAAGTLEGWQRQAVAAGMVQPVNQLFRGVYEPNADERANHVCRRFAGRQCRLGAMRRSLQKAGWETPGFYTGFVRRFAPPAVAELGLEDFVTIGEAIEIVTVGEVAFHGRDYRDPLPALDPLWFAEAVRDVDLATTAALADRVEGGVVSPEQLAARAALVRAFVPAATVLGERAGLPGGAIHLATGAAYDAAGNPLLLPDQPAPAAFPYPDPDPTTATVVVRALHLATAAP